MAAAAIDCHKHKHKPNLAHTYVYAGATLLLLLLSARRIVETVAVLTFISASRAAGGIPILLSE